MAVTAEDEPAFCVFCGDAPTTHEYAASRVRLDDPLPDDLPLSGPPSVSPSSRIVWTAWLCPSPSTTRKGQISQYRRLFRGKPAGGQKLLFE
jgi:hypothetical protein